MGDREIARTSDQPLQVKENIDLFMEALYAAIGLVVLIALVGFWDWRSALLLALSMPITLAMTAGMAHTVHIDLQVSIATLIIALGLRVDNPVVANDAIKRALAAGIPRIDAAWVGPTNRNSLLSKKLCLQAIECKSAASRPSRRRVSRIWRGIGHLDPRNLRRVVAAIRQR